MAILKQDVLEMFKSKKQNKTNQNNRMIDDLWHSYVPFFKTPFMSKLVCHFYII